MQWHLTSSSMKTLGQKSFSPLTWYRLYQGHDHQEIFQHSKSMAQSLLISITVFSAMNVDPKVDVSKLFSFLHLFLIAL
jgi:hypothetical protein